MKAVQFVPQELVCSRSVEQIVDVPYRQVQEELVEVITVVPQERMSESTVEPIVVFPVPPVKEEIVKVVLITAEGQRGLTGRGVVSDSERVHRYPLPRAFFQRCCSQTLF